MITIRDDSVACVRAGDGSFTVIVDTRFLCAGERGVPDGVAGSRPGSGAERMTKRNAERKAEYKRVEPPREVFLLT